MRRQRGAVLIEMAIVLPILVLLCFAALEFSMAISEYKIVLNQVRSASRYLTTRVPGTGHAEARCLVSHGIATSSTNCGGGPPVLPRLADGSAIIEIKDAINDPGHRSQATAGSGSVRVDMATVTVRGYVYAPISGLQLGSILGATDTFTFGPISSTMRQIG